MQIFTYLTFNGNCREAMVFYRKCIGGKLKFQTVGNSPLSAKMPAKMKDCILHASLNKDGLQLMGSDMTPGAGRVVGNAVSLSLQCNSLAQLKSCYKKLSDGGMQQYPIEKTFYGAMLGGLVDRYGNNWLLHFYNL